MKIAILGASGIGNVHARIFNELNVEVDSILGSSISSSSYTARFLKRTLGVNPKPFSDIKQLMNLPLDGISICTPPHLHYKQILLSFDLNLPVFCEKPLFWERNCDYKTSIQKLNKLKNHCNRHLVLNTSNSLFIEYIMTELFHENHISYFLFKFHTKGNNIDLDIAVDLLPHGMALLQAAFGHYEPCSFCFESGKNSFRCN